MDLSRIESGRNSHTKKMIYRYFRYLLKVFVMGALYELALILCTEYRSSRFTVWRSKISVWKCHQIVFNERRRATLTHAGGFNSQNTCLVLSFQQFSSELLLDVRNQCDINADRTDAIASRCETAACFTIAPLIETKKGRNFTSLRALDHKSTMQHGRRLNRYNPPK